MKLCMEIFKEMLMDICTGFENVEILHNEYAVWHPDIDIYEIMICGYLDDGDSVLVDDIVIYGRPGLCLIHLCYAWDAKVV